LKLLADRDQVQGVRIAALGGLQPMWDEKDPKAVLTITKAMLALLDDADGDLRRLAADSLALNVKPADRTIQEALITYLGDNDPSVRRAVALAIGRIGAPGAAGALVNIFRFDDGEDVFLTDGLVRAIERLGSAGIQQLLDLADSGVDKERDKVVEAYLGLRTQAAAESLPKLLKNPHLSIAQRAALVRSFSNYLLDPPVSPNILLDYLTTQSEAREVKKEALKVLAPSGALKTEKGRQWLLKLLDEEPDLRLEAVQAVEETRLAEAAPKLITIYKERRPIYPAERVAIIKALRLLNDKSAVPLLREAANPRGQPNEEGLEALRTLAVLDPSAGRQMALAWLEAENPLTLQS
jgi:HEAT repeat protein